MSGGATLKIGILEGGAMRKGEARETRPFWRTKTLEEMTPSEWEALCDRCGWCCVVKWIDPATDEVCHSRVACRLLDLETCRCRNYRDRRRVMSDCVRLTPARVRGINWLPWNCAYRRLKEGRGLPRWHPLVSGDPESVYRAGRSARGRLTSEADRPREDAQDR